MYFVVYCHTREEREFTVRNSDIRNKSFISPTNAQLNCFKILKFTLKFTINAPSCFGLAKPSSGSLQSVLR